MNNIAEKQNEQKSLDMLFVQRYLYSSAKNYFGWRTFTAVLLAICGPLTTSQNSEFSAYVGIAAIFYLLLDNLLLEKIENSKKEQAASFQEQFDTGIFDLPWNSIVVGAKPASETIALILSRNPKRDYSSLKNWYAIDVSRIDLVSARFLCQRSNAWWDTELRKKYLFLICSFLFIVMFIIVILGIFLDLTIGKFILGIIFPIAPLLELLVKQTQVHIDTSRNIGGFQKKLDSIIEDLLQKRTVPNPRELARVFQDEIFRHRKKCPMVFDCVYWCFRDDQESQMQFSIQNKVDELLKT